MCTLYKLRRSASEVTHWADAIAQPDLNFAETVYPGYRNSPRLGGRVAERWIVSDAADIS